MRSLVIYYSHYGNTAIVAGSVKEALAKHGEADILEIQYAGRRKGLFHRAFFRLFPQLVRLAVPPPDVAGYGLLCFGIPVWGGKPSAPLTKFLSLLASLKGKKIICFYIFTIEVSAKSCARFVSNILKRKSPAQVFEAFVPWLKVYDEKFLDEVISRVLSKAIAI